MPSMKTDSGWLEDFRARYAEWWPAAAPMIERHDYASAFKAYPWPTFATTPWTSVAKPLAESRIGVVTTGGLYRAGIEDAFDGHAGEGDWSYRAVPADVPIQGLAIAHEHFAHDVAKADMNTIFPLDRLRELEAAGVVKGLAAVHYSIMGYCPRAADSHHLALEQSGGHATDSTAALGPRPVSPRQHAGRAGQSREAPQRADGCPARPDRHRRARRICPPAVSLGGRSGDVARPAAPRELVQLTGRCPVGGSGRAFVFR